MANQAKVLTSEQVDTVLAYVEKTSRHILRDTLIVLLSFKAGLRVGEIAGLRWRDVTDAFGQLRDDAFDVPSEITKKGSGRTLPMHPKVQAALVMLRAATLNPDWLRADQPIIRSLDGTGAMLPNTLQRYIGRLYASVGLQGCSSHSGRRSFLTAAARIANQHGCSLRDVQRLAGHRDIETTELYVEASSSIASLVGAI